MPLVPRFFIQCPYCYRLATFLYPLVFYLLVYPFAYSFYAANAVFDSLFDYLCHPLFILILTDNLPYFPPGKLNRKFIPLLTPPLYYCLDVIFLFCYNRPFFSSSLLIQNKLPSLFIKPVRLSVDEPYFYSLFILVAALSLFPLAVHF